MKKAILILTAFTLIISCKDRNRDDANGTSGNDMSTSDTSYTQQDYSTTDPSPATNTYTDRSSAGYNAGDSSGRPINTTGSQHNTTDTMR